MTGLKALTNWVWILRHIDIEENEFADKPAKKLAQSPSPA